MSDGGRWRRIYSNEWHSGAFQCLSDSERVVYFYVKTGPPSVSVGISRISAAVAVEDIGNLTAVEFQQRLDVVIEAFGWRYDPRTRVLWIPTWLEDNPPQSPNVVVSWRKLIANLPDCELKTEAATAIVRYLKALPKAFLEAFGEDFPKDIRNSKAKPKSLPESNQGAGDQGIQRSERKGTGALRAVALNDINTEWLTIARATVAKYGRQDLEVLADHFRYEGHGKTANAKQSDIIAALNVAVAEQRSGVA